MHLFLDILIDWLFHKKAEEKILVLTDRGWPVTIYQNEVQVHTPFLTVSDDFGIDYQTGIAHLVHGATSIRVKKPRVGQMIYLWSNTHWGIVSPRQKVLRVYDNAKLAKVTPAYIREILDKLGNPWISEMDLIPKSKHKNEFADAVNFILSLTCGLITDRMSDEWKLTEHQSSAFPTVSKVNGQNPEGQDVFYYAGYIYESNKQIYLTNATIILLMEAVHLAFPKKTIFNKDGILQLAS